MEPKTTHHPSPITFPKYSYIEDFNKLSIYNAVNNTYYKICGHDDWLLQLKQPISIES